MQIETSIDTINSVTKTLSIKVPSDETTKVLNNVYAKLGRQANIKGFRKGKVPRSVLEQYYRSHAEQEAVESIIQQSFISALEETKLQPLTQPTVEDMPKLSKGEDFSYSMKIEIKPEIKVQDLSAISFEGIDYQVSDTEVDMEINRLQEEMSNIQPVKRRKTIRDKDIVPCTITVFDGEEKVDTLSSDNQTLTIGTGGLYEALEKKLKGSKLGEEVEAELVISEDHWLEDYQGKTLRAVAVSHELKERVMPEVDDDFAQDVDEKYETVDALKAGIKEKLEEIAARASQNQKRSAVLDALIEAHDFEIPEGLVKEQAQMIAFEPYQQFPREMLQSFWAEHGEGLTEKAMPEASRRVRGGFVCEVIENENNIEVTDADMDAHIKRLSERTGQPATAVKSQLQKAGQLEQTQSNLLSEKILDFCIAQAKVKKKKEPLASLMNKENQ